MLVVPTTERFMLVTLIPQMEAGTPKTQITA